MKLCGSCSSYQGHVQRIPALSFTESLRITRYSNIAVPKPLELSNYCWVIKTADCSSSWTPWTIKTYFSFKLFFSVPESKRYTYLIALLLQKINKWMNKYELRRFRGLLIHSLVTPMNMKKSSLNFGDQPLKFQIGQEFYLSGQNWYLIDSLKETSSLSNCCELERNIFFHCFIV